MGVKFEYIRPTGKMCVLFPSLALSLLGKMQCRQCVEFCIHLKSSVSVITQFDDLLK